MAEKEEIACRMSMLFNVMQTAAQMARDRKYQVAEVAVPKNLEDFRSKFEGEGGKVKRDGMTVPCEHRLSGEIMHIIFNGDPKLSVKELNDIRRNAQSQGAGRILLILSDKPNPICRKEIERYAREEHGVKVQAFLEEDLVVNITRHELVPEHTPLEPDEAKKVLEAHSLSIEMLPRMLATDPVSQYFGLERGRIVRIKRKSESAGEYVTYRQVV
jgi:DNA-directed RNA polymerase I, II, and III subunit RPABC1